MYAKFLDTNILLRYFTRDDEGKARRALALLMKVERGEEKVMTSPMVVFETVFTLQHHYQVPRDQISELVSGIISLKGLQLTGKELYYRAFDLYIQKKISFVDAYNVAYMENQEISDIYSWDRDFDKIEGIKRLEPTEED